MQITSSSGHAKKRVLIGSCGGLTGVYLARRLSSDPGLEIWGADCEEHAVAQFFVERMIRLPQASQKGFIDALMNELVRCSVDYYIPTHSVEMRSVAENETIIRHEVPGVSFAVSPVETFRDLDNKRLMSLNLSAAGIPTPNLYADKVNETQFPIFMKRCLGSGGTGAGVILSPAAYVAALEDYPDALFFELVNGPEFTVDCMFDTGGMLLGYNQRRRVKTLGGAAVVTTNDYSINIEPWVRKIAERWTFKGCVNFQCIIRNGVPMFTDINLRFPSGGLPLTVESGIDVPHMLVRLLAGEAIKPGEYTSDKLPRTMYRFFDERYEVAL